MLIKRDSMSEEANAIIRPHKGKTLRDNANGCDSVENAKEVDAYIVGEC